MGRKLTAKDVATEHRDALPENVGALFHALWNEVSLLHLVLRFYTDLYEKEADRRVVNEAAGTLFHWLQRVLWDDLALRLARLFDERKDVASLMTLSRRLRPHLPLGTWEDFKARLERAGELARPVIERRNNEVAHKNLGVATGAAIAPSVEFDAVRRLAREVERYSTSSRSTINTRPRASGSW